jgi:hypothetical protein
MHQPELGFFQFAIAGKQEPAQFGINQHTSLPELTQGAEYRNP